MQPAIGVWFWDITQTTNYGSVRICPPNTDTGWHLYTFTVTVPAGAQLMTVQSYCEYIPTGSGVVNAQLTANVFSGSNVTIPVNNTTNMAVGETVAIAHVANIHPPLKIVLKTPILSFVPSTSFNANLGTYNFFSGDSVTGAFVPGTCYFVGFVPAGTALPSGTASATQWAVSNYRVTQNGNPVYMPLTTFASTTGFSYSQTSQFVFPLYYLSLFTSEYQTAPNLYAWAAALISPTMDMLAFTQQMYGAFNLATAVGPQLDIIGAIVGANRQLPFQPSSGMINSVAATNKPSGYVSGDVVTIVQAGASGGTCQLSVYPGTILASVVTSGAGYSTANGLATTGGSGSGLIADITTSTLASSSLSDSDYRILIYAKAAQNQWNGSIASIYALWNQIYPGSRMTFIDNQNMTCTIVLASATLTSLQLQMIENGLILPRPQGVLYIFTTAMEPIFGFDLNNSVIAGFDSGNFS